VESAILVRHAESVFSAQGLATGRADVRCPLSERGVAQARALGDELAGQDIDLCITSELERTKQTADIALAGRAVPRLVLAALNDPLYGRYEGGLLAEYVAWAVESDSAAEPPGGGEARQAIVARYAAGFRRIVDRPERVIFLVTHSLPIAYALLALDGREPAPRLAQVEYAKPYVLARDDVIEVITRLEAWCAAPTW
jgi:broad specificity phosphatase PhoE